MVTQKSQPSLTKDARTFVDSVMTSLRHDAGKNANLPKMEVLLTKVSQSAKKEKQAEVQSAVALTTAEKDAIKKSLEKLFGHELELTVTVKPELIAGIRISVSDWIFDASYSYGLEKMADFLMK
jgi:F-type H+-transporting ATPase subunit delta